MSANRNHPWLSKHRIAKPCSMKWTEMSGDEKKRFCGKCKLNVYNLSAMSAGEAENLLARTHGKVCTYFYQRADGTVLTQDCPVGLRQTLRTRGIVAAAAYALSLLFSVPAARAGGHPTTGTPPRPELLGGAPAMIGGESVTPPSPTPSPSPSPRCPRTRALMGKPAVQK